jgi:hypothetical protein
MGKVQINLKQKDQKRRKGCSPRHAAQNGKESHSAHQEEYEEESHSDHQEKRTHRRLTSKCPFLAVSNEHVSMTEGRVQQCSGTSRANQ